MSTAAPPLRVRPTPSLRAVQSWLTPSDLREIHTARYWNDIEEERAKEWWIEEGNYDRCRHYLQHCGLMQEYQQAEAFIRTLPQRQLRVADLAAGTGWTTALLSRVANVAEVHAVDISQHRLERLFPHSVAMLEGEGNKIHRYLGSFYDLQLAPLSIDVVFMSHAFHHAHRPLQLLVQCDRVLKPGGLIVVSGEHEVGLRQLVRRFAGTLLRERRVVTDFRRLFPPDPVLGDHYYRRADYRLLFEALGYRLEHRVAASGNGLYVGAKPSGVAGSRSNA